MFVGPFPLLLTATFVADPTLILLFSPVLSTCAWDAVLTLIPLPLACTFVADPTLTLFFPPELSKCAWDAVLTLTFPLPLACTFVAAPAVTLVVGAELAHGCCGRGAGLVLGACAAGLLHPTVTCAEAEAEAYII